MDCCFEPELERKQQIGRVGSFDFAGGLAKEIGTADKVQGWMPSSSADND